MSSSGYLHPLYVQSLIEFGEPVELPASGGWILKRRISGTPLFDGMGCYPVFACRDWSNLKKDLNRMGDELISLSLVTDPFGKYSQQELIDYFMDMAKPYKEHFVVDLQRAPEGFITAHHWRNAHKALKVINVEVCTQPNRYLDDWISLYNTLIERHTITGMTKFSRFVFSRQMEVPGMVVFRANLNGKTVGMLLWYIQDDVAYYHLGAHSLEGYKHNSSFALFWMAIDHFASMGLQWLSLGAGAGVQGDANDGLTRFKRGWSTGTRTAYFCGRIFNSAKYHELVRVKHIPSTEFFPAYRLGEY